MLVGCTGGIGSGKSTVAALLAARGATVVDADAKARAALEPGTPGHEAVVTRFGAGYLDGDGAIDRARLARLVFSDPGARRELEAIVHPFVSAAIAREIERAEEAGATVVVIDAPLLVETGGRDRYGLDGVLVVDVPEELALERLVERRHMDPEDARARLGAHLGRMERIRAADYVILNIGTEEELEAMVDEVWRWIEGLADAR